jgi:Rrf2 family protein
MRIEVDMLSKTAIHALHAVAQLAELPEGQFRGATSIAEQIGAPANYLGKLLQSLVQEGIVYSQKGIGGGFRLAKKASEVSLYDVVEPIDHISKWSGCFMGRERCSSEDPCSMHSRWAKVRDEYFLLLKESTIADIAPNRQPLMISL